MLYYSIRLARHLIYHKQFGNKDQNWKTSWTVSHPSIFIFHNGFVQTSRYVSAHALYKKYKYHIVYGDLKIDVRDFYDLRNSLIAINSAQMTLLKVYISELRPIRTLYKDVNKLHR